jgi:hypothetical protein
MSSQPAIDQEVLELLGELARDPDSRLLRVPPDGFRRWLDATERPLSAREPFLIRSERYLLQEHREQVAFLLYKACQRALLGLPLWKSMVHRSAGQNMQVEVPSFQWWLREVAASSSTQPTDRDAAEALRDFRSDLGPSARNEASPVRLATASLRIHPRDQTRIWLGLALQSEGMTAEAQQAHRQVIEHCPTELLASLAREDLGSVFMQLGNPLLAMEQYRASCSDEPRPNPVLGFLHAALWSERRAEAIAASALLEELNGEARGLVLAAIAEHLTMWQARRLPTSSAAFAARLSPALADTAGNFVHALTQTQN